eukprot:365725-Chlamydomonas_euryale.AAC.50
MKSRIFQPEASVCAGTGQLLRQDSHHASASILHVSCKLNQIFHPQLTISKVPSNQPYEWHAHQVVLLQEHQRSRRQLIAADHLSMHFVAARLSTYNMDRTAAAQPIPSSFHTRSAMHA